jgi:hypothetical protein
MENQGLAATRRCDCREQRRKTTFGRFLADPPYVEIQASQEFSGSVNPAAVASLADKHRVRRGPEPKRNVSHCTSRGGWGVV